MALSTWLLKQKKGGFCVFVFRAVKAPLKKLCSFSIITKFLIFNGQNKKKIACSLSMQRIFHFNAIVQLNSIRAKRGWIERFHIDCVAPPKHLILIEAKWGDLKEIRLFQKFVQFIARQTQTKRWPCELSPGNRPDAGSLGGKSKLLETPASLSSVSLPWKTAQFGVISSLRNPSGSKGHLFSLSLVYFRLLNSLWQGLSLYVLGR